jgi:energy-coupling factor transport system permease protein
VTDVANIVGDVVLGRFYAADSLLHRMDPRIKLTITVVYMVASVLAVNLWGVAMLTLFTTVAILCSNIPVRKVLQSIKPLLFILVITALLNILATNSGTVYMHWVIFTISSGGLFNALVFTLRVGLMLCGASLLTLTTSPVDLTDGMESILQPFTRFGLPSHELAMMTSIALRFLPTFMDEAIRIKHAQESRGAIFDAGGPIARLKLVVPLLAPLFASAFRHADTLSMAMESRCYNGGEGRVCARQLKVRRADLVALALTAFLVIGLVTLRLVA